MVIDINTFDEYLEWTNRSEEEKMWDELRGIIYNMHLKGMTRNEAFRVLSELDDMGMLRR